jgi:hypothetical protein
MSRFKEKEKNKGCGGSFVKKKKAKVNFPVSYLV